MTPEMLAKNELVIDGGLKSLEICKRAGIKVGYGTDLLGALQVDQSREFLLRREVLSPIEIIRQATLVGAEIVRMPGQARRRRAGRVRRHPRRRRRPDQEARVADRPGREPVGDHEGRPLPQEPPGGLMAQGAIASHGGACCAARAAFARLAARSAAIALARRGGVRLCRHPDADPVRLLARASSRTRS